jgi:hypothetical protein
MKMKTIFAVMGCMLFISSIAFGGNINYAQDVSPCIRIGSGDYDCSESASRKIAQKICKENGYDKFTNWDATPSCGLGRRMVLECIGGNCYWSSINGSRSCFTEIECVSGDVPGKIKFPLHGGN